MNLVNKVGVAVLILGVAMLIAGLLCAFTVGTVLVPILVTSSIGVNSLGIMLLQSGQNRRRRRGE